MFPLETDSTRVVAACSLILAGGTLTTVFDTVLDLIKNGVTKGQENAMKQFTKSLTQMLITCTPSWKLMYTFAVRRSPGQPNVVTKTEKLN